MLLCGASVIQAQNIIYEFPASATREIAGYTSKFSDTTKFVILLDA